MVQLHLFFNTIITILHVMKQFAAILFMVLAFASTAEAQSFLDHIREKKAGQGQITVTESAAIDELVNNAKLTKSSPSSAQKASNQNTTQPQKSVNHIQQHASNATKTGLSTQHVTQHTQQATTQQHATQHNNDSANRANARAAETKHNATNEHTAERNNTAKRQNDNDIDTPIVDMSKKVMRNSYKVTGYRVQAYAGGNSRADRQKAENIGSAIKMRFPDQPVYVHFYSPRWICRIGNYRTFQEASNMLKAIKAMGYKQACIVKGKISVAY